MVAKSNEAKKERRYTRPEKYLEHPVVALYSNPAVVGYFKEAGKIDELEFGDFQYLLCYIKPRKGDYEKQWKKVFDISPDGKTGLEKYRGKDQLGQELMKLVEIGILKKTKKACYVINPIHWLYTHPFYDSLQMKKYTPKEVQTDFRSGTAFYGLNTEGMLEEYRQTIRNKLSKMGEEYSVLTQKLKDMRLGIFRYRTAQSIFTILKAGQKERLKKNALLLLSVPVLLQASFVGKEWLGRKEEKCLAHFTIDGKMKQHILEKLPKNLRNGVIEDEKKLDDMWKKYKKYKEKVGTVEKLYKDIQESLIDIIKKLYPQLASVVDDEMKKVKKAREEFRKEGMVISYF